MLILSIQTPCASFSWTELVLLFWNSPKEINIEVVVPHWNRSFFQQIEFLYAPGIQNRVVHFILIFLHFLQILSRTMRPLCLAKIRLRPRENLLLRTSKQSRPQQLPKTAQVSISFSIRGYPVYQNAKWTILTIFKLDHALFLYQGPRNWGVRGGTCPSRFLKIVR